MWIGLNRSIQTASIGIRIEDSIMRDNLLRFHNCNTYWWPLLDDQSDDDHGPQDLEMEELEKQKQEMFAQA